MNKKKIIILIVVLVILFFGITLNQIIKHKKEKLNSTLNVKTEELKQKKKANKTNIKKQKKKLKLNGHYLATEGRFKDVKKLIFMNNKLITGYMYKEDDLNDPIEFKLTKLSDKKLKLESSETGIVIVQYELHKKYIIFDGIKYEKLREVYDECGKLIKY